jgi:hypothetical protein
MTNKIIPKAEKRTGTIGTLKEKTLHASIKNYLEPDISHQEIKVEGYYADIVQEGHIIEVQTRNFNTLRDKLEVFLKSHQVTIVYPMARTKYLNWINDDGEVISRRRSPKTGQPLEACFELYRIKPFLKHPQLSVKIIMLDLEEYRNLDGWSRDKKKGSSRYDQIPLQVTTVIDLIDAKDYARLLPDDLPATFTTKDLHLQAHISLKRAQIACNILSHLEVIQKTGKQNKMITYQKTTS